MFDQIKNKNQVVKSSESNSTTINLIGAGTSIEGEVTSAGDIRVDGTIIGSVNSKAKVVVGSTGMVQGDIICQNADISGTVKGKTNVTEMLFLKSTARINGDIQTGKLVVEVGAVFTGTCNMGGVVKDIKHVDKPGEQQLKKNPLNNYARYSAMVFQMAAIIFGLSYAGIKLDDHFQMKRPVFTTSLALFSIFLAIYFAIKDFIKK